jgi:hypothetical protein
MSRHEVEPFRPTTYDPEQASGKGDLMSDPKTTDTEVHPVVTPAEGLEGRPSMVTTTAPPLGAPAEKAKPWPPEDPNKPANLPGQPAAREKAERPTGPAHRDR